MTMIPGVIVPIQGPITNTGNVPPRPLTTADIPSLVELIAKRVVALLQDAKTGAS